MSRVRILCLLCAFCLLFPASAPSASVSAFSASGEADAERRALALFCECAFHPEFGSSPSSGLLTRWESEITVFAGGNPEKEDLAVLDAFLAELSARVPGLPPVRRVSLSRDAAVRVWYVPLRMLPSYIEGYVDGNWGFFHFDTSGSRIVSARIGIASDVTEQEERNHLMNEELVGALGLPGDHMRYSDSILYDAWTTVQELSEVDWRMLNLLYSSAVSPGMTEQQARDALAGAEGL